MEHWQKLAEVVPFLLSTKDGIKMNKARILESLITAAIIVGVTYGMLKSDVSNVKDSITEIKQDIRAINTVLFGKK